MIPFTKEEISTLRQIVFPTFSIDAVHENFDLVGGVPRLIFFNTAQQLKDLISENLNDTGAEFIKRFDGENYHSLVGSEMSYILVHLLPNPKFIEANKDCNLLAIPSNYIFSKFRRVQDNVFQNLQRMLALSENPALQQYHGLLFENLFRSKSWAGSYELTSLGGFCIYGKEQFTGKTGQTVCIEWNHSGKFSKGMKCDEGVFYLSSSLNQGALDGFVICGSIVYMFQLTAARNHPVRGDILSEIYDNIKLHANVTITNCALVFLLNECSSTLLDKVQPLHDKTQRNYSSASAIPAAIYHLVQEQWRLILPLERLLKKRNKDK